MATRKALVVGLVVLAAASVYAMWFLFFAGDDASGRATSCADDPQPCELACDEGDLASCYRLGEDFYGAGPQQDHERALAAFTKGCAIGPAGRVDPKAQPDPLGFSCFLAGAIWSGQHGHATDRARAWAFYHEACTYRFGHACNALGEMYENGVGAPRDLVEAHRYHALGCGYGSEFGCNAANRLAP